MDGIVRRTSSIWSAPVGLVWLVMFGRLFRIMVGIVTRRLLFKRMVRGRMLG